MTRYLASGILTLLAILAHSGCSDADRPSLTSAARAQTQAAVGPATPALMPEPVAVTEPELATEEFKPPYPDRHDLFSPAAKVADAPERPDTAGDVALRGFVNVDGLRALLVINGRVTVTEAGRQYSGIDVVSIDPPQVTLQRGRIRWTEKLYQ